MTTTLVLWALLALLSTVTYGMYLRSVRRYNERVGDHNKTVEYAEVIRPGPSQWFRSASAAHRRPVIEPPSNDGEAS